LFDHLKKVIHPGLRGALFYGLYWGVIGMFEPYVTVHFIRLGFNGQQIGWLAAVFPLFNFIITPLISRLADRTNQRILILAVSFAGFGILLAFLPVPVTFLSVLALYALVMAFRSPLTPLSDSLIAHMSERHRLDFGSMRLWGSIIFTITSLSLGIVWQKTGFNIMFLVSGVAFIVVVFAAFLLDEIPAQPPQNQQKSGILPRTSRINLPEPGILFLLGGNFLLVGAVFMAGTFGTVYMASLKGGEAYLGALFGLSAMAEVPGMLFGRRIARRLGDTNTLILSYALIGVGLAGYAFSTSPWVMLLFAMVRGLGFGIFLVSTVTIINHRAPENQYATYQGLEKSLCWGLAPLLGGPLSGLLYQIYGPSTLFFLNAGMTAVAVLLLLPTFRLWKGSIPASTIDLSHSEG